MSDEKPREFWISQIYDVLRVEEKNPGYINPPDYLQLFHVIEKSAYDAVVAERDEARNDALSYEYNAQEYSLQLLYTQQEYDQLRRELETLKVDRDKFLASDDCYYWTPEAQKERDELKRKLAEARLIISGKTFSYDPRALAALKECARLIERYGGKWSPEPQRMLTKLRKDFPELFNP